MSMVHWWNNSDGKTEILEENFLEGQLSLPHLTNLFKVYMEPTHDWWEKAGSC
jgi:hypothetical protein